MPIQDRMDGADRWHLEIAIQLPQQGFADLARASVGFLAFQMDDPRLDLIRQLVGVTDRTARAIRERL